MRMVEVVAGGRGRRSRAARPTCWSVSWIGDTAATMNGSLATMASILTRRVKRMTAVNRPGECLMTETISDSTPISTRSRGADVALRRVALRDDDDLVVVLGRGLDRADRGVAPDLERRHPTRQVNLGAERKHGVLAVQRVVLDPRASVAHLIMSYAVWRAFSAGVLPSHLAWAGSCATSSCSNFLPLVVELGGTSIWMVT
jgi:hypothetical protein